jgi:hypothetical protein
MRSCKVEFGTKMLIVTSRLHLWHEGTKLSVLLRGHFNSQKLMTCNMTNSTLSSLGKKRFLLGRDFEVTLEFIFLGLTGSMK